MENKEKRKRRVSTLTVFIWLALIVTMSVIVISGISKSNALEEGETKNITIKIDFNEYLENEGITEQEEIETYLEGYALNIWIANNNPTYVGCEENNIGIYEVNISNNSEKITIYWNDYYELLSNEEALEKNYSSGSLRYYKELLEDVNEYNFVVKKKDTRIVTIKIDFNDLIKDRGITDETEIEKILSEYYSRLTGRNDKDYSSAYVNLNSKYIGIEQDTIGVYEVEIPKDMEYIQVVRPYDVNYLELGVYCTYDMIINGKVLEITSSLRNGYHNPSSAGPACYILKVLDNVDEYNISIEEREEITINVGEYITKVDVLDQTNKIVERITLKDGKFNLKLSKGAEYDIIFVSPENYRKKYRGIYDEDGNELEQKMIYTPSSNKEMYNYYKTIKQGENKSEYTFNTNGRFESNIVWEDNINAKLQFKVRENWRFFNRYIDYLDRYYGEKEEWQNEYIVFIEKLDENFSVAKEYENDPKWLIANEDELKDKKFIVPEYAKGYVKLDLQNNKYMPEYVYANFFVNNFDEEIYNLGNVDYYFDTYIKSNGKIYNIYIKDKNMLYCLVPADTPNNLLSINLEYVGSLDNKEDEIYKFNTKSIYFWNEADYCSGMFEQPYVGSTLIEKQIKYAENKKTRIVVNKLLENTTENKKCYIGLFENDEEDTTDKIYDMSIENGVGSLKIEFEGYDKNRKYYIYEVDENGNKTLDEKITYSKNKVLENINKREEYNVSSDKSIVSSVYSISANEGYLDRISVDRVTTTILKKLSDDIGKGKGEAYYNDNSLLVTEVYEDVVTISENNEKAYLVKYETKKGGTLEGDTEEVVREGEKPANIPNIKVKENYEFEKWVIIKDGEEIEVNPSEYVILEDTTFIAKYKEIKVVDKIDTSDINVWLYVGIAVISVMVIIIIILIFRVNKSKLNKEDKKE